MSILRRVTHRARVAASFGYRACLSGRTFVAVTGSAGKTTTTGLIQHLLSLRAPCHGGATGLNQREPIRRLLLSMPFTARACVTEVGAFPVDNIPESMAFFKPTVSVVLNAQFDRYNTFRGPDGAAAAKGRLVEALPADGLAVLNADDPRVLAMRSRTRARAVTFGMDESADVRGAEIDEGWPDRLSLTIAARGEHRRAQTPFVGKHWVYPTLAATAVAIEAGLTLDECAARLATFTPVFQRLSEHELRPGVTLLLDSIKAPLWTMPAALDVLRSARATRRILVIGTLSDYPGDSSRKYRQVAKQALGAADLVWFVGSNTSHVAKMTAAHTGLHHVRDVRLLCEQLLPDLRPGDLVLAKGSQSDHLERLLLHASGAVACWKSRCGVHYIPCHACAQRLIPSEPDSAPAARAV